jgi:hypothetical protein
MVDVLQCGTIELTVIDNRALTIWPGFTAVEPCHTKQEVFCLSVIPITHPTHLGLLNFVLRGTMTSCSLCIRLL